MIKYRRELFKLFARPGAAVEIGVAEGNFSEEMLRWAHHFNGASDGANGIVVTRLYMVDRWAQKKDQKGDAAYDQGWHDGNLARVKARTAPFSDRAVILQGDSDRMAGCVEDGSLSLVYIDGDHSYEGVMTDIKAWFPKLGEGGVMAFHDYESDAYGVKRAVKEFVNNRFEINRLPEDKIEDAGAWFRI